MYYKKQGKGTAIVFLHGFCETSAIWDPITPLLSKSYQTITLDLPGFGRSRHLEAPTTLSQLAKEVHCFLQSHRVEQYIVIGHSLGGYISLELGETFAESILGIGMINSTAFADGQEKVKTRKKTIRFVEKRGVEAFVKLFVPQLFADKKAKDITTVINLAKSTPEQSVINYSQAMMNRKSYISTLQRWKKPFLFVFGRQDTLVTASKSREHLRYISRNSLVELSEAGHMGTYEAPDKIIKLLIKFVRTIPK